MDNSAVDSFHAHLDACEQCEKHPFDLCPIGAPLLLAAAKECLNNMTADAMVNLREIVDPKYRMPTFDEPGPREEPTSFDVEHKPRRRNAARRTMAGDGRVSRP